MNRTNGHAGGRTSSQGVMAALAIAVAAAAGYAWWQHRQAPSAEADAAAETVASQAPQAASAPAAATAASRVQHPIEPPAGLPPLPPADKAEAYVNDRLIDLLGRPAVLSLLNGSQFIAHFVATVDNLPRESASSKVWPANPTSDRFLVDQAEGVTVMNPKNADRYTPLVNLLDTVDTHGAVALYRHLYPLFQQAYEDLGYPHRYFNDRLVAVIDHLLQAPEPEGPIALTLTEVKGPIPSTRPWVRYQFADADLEARSAGQKILMRMGPAHEKRVKARLAAFRAELVEGERPAR